MKLGKADSLGRKKGFLLLFTFLGSEGRGKEDAVVVTLGSGMERCITVTFLFRSSGLTLFPTLII